MNNRPLNGVKTHPLTEHSKGVLKTLASQGPKPAQEINNGVIDRLGREGLAEIVHLTSPYDKHRGGKCAHLQVTAAGRRVIERQAS